MSRAVYTPNSHSHLGHPIDSTGENLGERMKLLDDGEKPSVRLNEHVNICITRLARDGREWVSIRVDGIAISLVAKEVRVEDRRDMDVEPEFDSLLREIVQ